jgi:hypothetical protein
MGAIRDLAEVFEKLDPVGIYRAFDCTGTQAVRDYVRAE